ncbi:leucine-rich repeat protein [Skeletonema marinoi]|uniref:Leucine-rich repeat protein n=1 Tax=Skeletonema marinoi TaxID=267567 RepID=A0AAD8XUF9_9STRA|nr:leucine-rich repeat protein [Skeletonema marinoi]
MTGDTLTSSDATAAAMDRRILEQLLMMMMVHSLLQKEDDDDDGDALKKMAMECMAANKREQSAVSMAQLLVVAERMLDAQLLRLLAGGLEGREVLSSDAASDQQLMDADAAAAKKKRAAAKAAKKKRNKRNKAAAKPKKTKLVSWLGGGILPLIMMAAFGSITTLIAFSLIHQSDGSSEGEDPPTLPPSASTSLGQRDIQSIISPLPVPVVLAVKSPIFSPSDSDVSNPSMKSDDRVVSTCLDTPNWKDKDGYGCDHYEDMYESGCSGTEKWVGNMGLAIDHCCFCGGGSHTLPLTTSSSSICTEDTQGWYDQRGFDCVWYEVMDGPGCPKYGDQIAQESSTVKGTAYDHCCYCKNAVVASNVSPAAVASSSSETCVDTPEWTNVIGIGCKDYPENDFPGCPIYGTSYTGVMGSAAENCCYCKDPTCDDFNQFCEGFSGVLDYGEIGELCEKAASCSCKTDPFNIITRDVEVAYSKETFGLYNDCKCNYWLSLCEDREIGEACDYASEYCCGDKSVVFNDDGSQDFFFVNSPQCYCDFSKYVENEFGHKMSSKAIIDDYEYSNPCWQTIWPSSTDENKKSLEAIYYATNGQYWTNNDGWMDETVDHCKWYGISCDEEGHVTGIDLRDNNLAGQFPVYTRDAYIEKLPVAESQWYLTKYGLANLYELKTLDLAENKLTGTIEYRPLYNLRVLASFDVSGNQLSGEVEALIAPSIKYADFSNNGFTSMRRFEKYKVRSLQTLRYCDVSNNVIQQNATDILEIIAPNIEQFIASNNNISGSLPVSLNNLPKLRQFIMASNALCGDLPDFTQSFATLQELDVSNQTEGFTGPIPEKLWRSLSLKILNLADNMLTGTIPSLVGNLAVLEVLDLSNNLLKGSLSSELGLLGGRASLKRLGLSNNAFTGAIPVQVGQLQGASVLLKDNRFQNTSTTAPLNLCLEREVKEFDLADDTVLCPPDRNILSDFYDSAKGVEWTDGSLWLDEYASCCDWKGVACDDMNHVTKLSLSNNGLSGRLSKSIGNLTFMTEMDLSDNDIKASIPTELGKLSNLIYLRLSYNAFTGTVPEGLAEMKGLQLLQLQSNRITKMPIIPRLDDFIHGQSTFVTDCGVPSAFDEALECDNCTMCCNINEGCHPQEKTKVQKLGLKGYGSAAAALLTFFVALCFMVAFLLYISARRKNIGYSGTSEIETRIKENDMYALSKIGKDSVYSYFVTDKVCGWFIALATLGIQFGILVFFILASEANLQNDRTDIQFTWHCPRDTDACNNRTDLTDAGWAIYYVLMIAFLSKDMINGSKLIYHSAKITHSFKSRIRYFFGGTCLCLITLFALYVSTVYNKAIATSNTDIIVNSVIVLFAMDVDEWIFSTLEAINDNWTSHSSASDDEMKDKIASQQEELRSLREIVDRMQESQAQIDQIASQQEELRKLCEIVEKMQELHASAHSENVVAGCASDINAQQLETEHVYR